MKIILIGGILLGAVMLVALVNSVFIKKEVKKGDKYVLCFMMIISVVLLIASALGFLLNMADLFGFVALSVVGVFLLGLGIIDVRNSKKCVHMVCAELTEVISVGNNQYAPEFSYRYEDQDYVAGLTEPMTLDKMKNLYGDGKDVELYVDPDNPTHLHDKRLKKSSSALLVAIGLVFLLSGILCAVGLSIGFITVG